MRRVYTVTVSSKDVAHGLWFLAKVNADRGFAGDVVSTESAVVEIENASFLFRSLCLPYDVSHWTQLFSGHGVKPTTRCFRNTHMHNEYDISSSITS